MRTETYAWCFGHGEMHTFPTNKTPWCMSFWVAFTAVSEQEALDAKKYSWGDAQFLDDLPVNEKIDIIEMANRRIEMANRRIVS